jgi:hypothetical protein
MPGLAPASLKCRSLTVLQPGALTTTNSKRNGEKSEMLWTLVAILFVLWLLGLATSYTMGGLVHILLVLALVVIVVNLIRGRRATG